MDFNEARDDWVAVASAKPHVDHLHFSPDRYNHASTPSLNFYGPDALPGAPPVSKH